MTLIQKIINSYCIKNIEDFENLKYEYQLLIVNDIREHLHNSGDIDMDWDIMANHASQVVQNQLNMPAKDFQDFMDHLFVEGYKSVIENNMYVPSVGEDDEMAFASRADDLYKEQSEWYVG